MNSFINREEAKFIIDNWIILQGLKALHNNIIRNKDIIEAFAKGEEIEYKNTYGIWESVTINTIYIDNYSYRIKISKSKEEEFFEQVKGKKIRQKKWPNNNLYFTPEYLSKIHMTGRYSTFEDMLNPEPILNGFEDWEFYKGPEYVPFTFEDAPKIIGRVIRHKLNKTLIIVDKIESFWDTRFYNLWVKYYELLTIKNGMITKVDPCGKIKEDKK